MSPFSYAKFFAEPEKEGRISGYAVIMRDKSSPSGLWFVAIYNDRETAELLVGKNKSYEIIKMREVLE